MVDRPFPQGREDPVEGPQVLEQTVMVVRPRLEQRAKDLRAETVLGTGIPVAVAVRVEREAVMQGTVDPVCWFRFWDVIFTGAVVVEALDILLVVVTVEWEEEVVERSVPRRGVRV